ncbi:basic proline-rich protein-like [Empidonax traillii]|uniref:basic proline-rich protein-like n=1 Tax=Empidonax traillii TaxID=164674 RepID=UPI000FFD277A|nr:basic proline-rich protein-like [Empidonax traillii]
MLKPPGPSGEAPVTQRMFPAIPADLEEQKEQETHRPLPCSVPRPNPRRLLQRPARAQLLRQVPHHTPGARQNTEPAPTPRGRGAAAGTPRARGGGGGGNGPGSAQTHPPARAAAPPRARPHRYSPPPRRPARRSPPRRGRSRCLAHPPCPRPGPAPLRRHRGRAAPATLGCGGHRLPARPGPASPPLPSRTAPHSAAPPGRWGRPPRAAPLDAPQRPRSVTRRAVPAPGGRPAPLRPPPVPLSRP